MRKIVFSLIFILFLISVFVYVQTKKESYTFDTSKNIPILYAQGQGVLVWNDKRQKWCLAGMCGTISAINDTEFQINWEVESRFKREGTSNTFVEKNGRLYLLPQNDTALKFHLTKENKDILCYSKSGTCLDEATQKPYLFLRVSEDMPKGSAVSAKLYFKDLENKTRIYIADKKNNLTLQFKEKQKDFRFLLGISSYKRPVFLSGQVLRMMNQTYKNLAVSVSVKGFTQKNADLFLSQEWRPFVEEKRLFVRFDDNKAQFSNLLDTFRDQDLSEYDYVCKIDDDDWYSPDYLEVMNMLLQDRTADEMPSIIISPMFYQLVKQGGKVILQKTEMVHHGSATCFSKAVAEYLLEVEKLSDDEINKLFEGASERRVNPAEDELIYYLAQQKGAPITVQFFGASFLYNKLYPSVSRPKD